MFKFSKLIKSKISNHIFLGMFVLTSLLLIGYYLFLFFHIIPEFEDKLINNKKEFLFEMSNSMALTLNDKIENEPDFINDIEQLNKFIKEFDYGPEKSDYYFLINSNGIMLSHPNQELIGTDVRTSLIDNNGFELGKAILEISQTSGNGYLSYNWPKQTNFDVQIKKTTYVETFGKSNLILGTGIYIDDIEKLVNDTAGHIVNHTISILIIVFILLLLIIKIGGKIEKEKHLIENDYFSLAEHLSIGVFRLAIRKTVYPVMQNTAMLKIFGIPEQDRKAMEKGKIKIVNFIKDEQIKGYIFNKVMKREPIEKMEFEIINTKGKSLWVNFEGRITTIGDEKFYDGIVEDITESHKTHKLLEQSYEKLKKEDLLKDEIIGITGHELRTPLTIIKGFAAMLKNEKIGSLNTQQDEYIDKIINSSNKLLLMINNMLDLSKLEAGEITLVPEKIKLREFIMGIYKNFIDQAKKEEKTINIDIPEEDIMIEYDSQYLERVIVNLLSNALKFTTPKQGLIDIIIKKNNSNTLDLIIKDNGDGISQDDIEDIFLKFKQVGGHMKRTAEGTGLGLTIVKVILEQMGTKIHVKSKLGEGSEFYFTLNLKK